jgi:hypothetical protein
MPKISHAEREATLARNLAAARAIAAHMHWTVAKAACLPPAIRASMLFVPDAELLICPWQVASGVNVRDVAFAISAIRSDALAVGVGLVGDHYVGVYSTIGLWTAPVRLGIPSCEHGAVLQAGCGWRPSRTLRRRPGSPSA